VSTTNNTSDDFYADDVKAEAIADNKEDPDTLVEDEDLPVTSGDMEIGDLDHDAELGQGGEDSYDEESVPGGEDNVTGDPDDNSDAAVEPDDVASE